MAKKRLFGETISPKVVRQLEKRAEVLSNAPRTSNDLRYLNEKTSWIRVISGVDTYDYESKTFNNKEAKEFILSGGELTWDGSRFVKRQTFNSGGNEERGRYNYDKDLGIRPEAGITSFSIKHIGTYGALREANFTFNVWTRNDLEKAESLFLRPGMTVLVEWGNSIFLNNEGSVKDTVNLVDQNNYFSKNTYNRISEILQVNRLNNSFNYDGFLGYITNFSWSYRGDGGYDCSIKAITRGAVLESLSTYKPLRSTLKDIEGSVSISSRSNLTNDLTKTYLHYVLDLITDRSAILTERQEAKENERLQNIFNPLSIELGIELDQAKNLFQEISFDERPKTNAPKEKDIYISIRTLLALMNIAFQFKVPSGEKLTSFLVKKDQNLIEPDYVTFSQHFSLNPLYCILPKAVSIEDSKGNKSILEIGFLTDKIANEEKGTITKINSIYVNFNEIVGDLTKFLEGTKEPRKANIYDFIKSILTNLNSRLGYINSFDLSYDEDLEKWFIVDRNCIFSEKSENLANTVALLDVTGLKSTVSNLQLNTSITPELTSQIAISAQAGSVNSIDVNLPLAQWNSHKVDRFTFEANTAEENRTVSTLEQQVKIFNDPFGLDLSNQDRALSPEQTEAFEQQAEDIIDFVENFERDGFFKQIAEAFKSVLSDRATETELGGTTGTGARAITISNNNFNYDQELYEKLKADAYVRFKNAVYGTSTEGAETISNSGLIPIVLELKLDGISGIKIGQIFKLGDLDNPSNVLPSVYNLYGFIVTGVDSEIENSKWYTTIRGLTFRLVKTENQATGKL